MGILDRLLGRTPDTSDAIRPNTLRPPRPTPPPGSDTDDVAVERYRYLLRTAPPGELEQAHLEAFERLTPEQRAKVREDLEATVPAGEAPSTTDPQALARAATRAEMRAPGTLERAFGGGPAGAAAGGSFLHTFAAMFIATSMAQALFGGYGEPAMADGGAEGEAGAWDGDAAADAGGLGDAGDLGDAGGLDDAGGFGDLGDFGDFGGFDL